MNDTKKQGLDEVMGKKSPNEPDPNGEIGSRLRAYFSSVQQEPVPERFLDLLEKLDASEKDASGARSEA